MQGVKRCSVHETLERPKTLRGKLQRPLRKTHKLQRLLRKEHSSTFCNSHTSPLPSVKAGSQVRRKRECGRKRKHKRRSHVERKSKQNQIRTRISLSQDGGNLVTRVSVSPVTVEKSGLNLNR